MDFGKIVSISCIKKTLFSLTCNGLTTDCVKSECYVIPPVLWMYTKVLGYKWTVKHLSDHRILVCVAFKHLKYNMFNTKSNNSMTDSTLILVIDIHSTSRIFYALYFTCHFWLMISYLITINAECALIDNMIQKNKKDSYLSNAKQKTL